MSDAPDDRHICGTCLYHLGLDDSYGHCHCTLLKAAFRHLMHDLSHREHCPYWRAAVLRGRCECGECTSPAPGAWTDDRGQTRYPYCVWCGSRLNDDSTSTPHPAYGEEAKPCVTS